MKRWITIIVLSLILIMAIGLLWLAGDGKIYSLLKNHAADARDLTWVLEYLRDGDIEMGISSLEDQILRKLRMAGQRLDSVQNEVSLDRPIAYFRQWYDMHALDDRGNVPPALFDAVQASAHGEHKKVGDPSPIFTAWTLDGTEVRLDRHSGKIILINFFATWCGPCLDELPELQEQVWERYRHDSNFELFLIGLGHTTDDLVRYRTDAPFTMQMIADPDSNIFHKFARTGIPRTYVIDRDGMIIYHTHGYESGDMERLGVVLADHLQD